MNRILNSALCILALLVFQKARGQNDFSKNCVSIGIIGGTSYSTSEDYQGFIGLNYLSPYDFSSLQLTYSRRLTKNIFLSASTYKIREDNRRYTLGSKLNALVSYRLQPGLIMDYAFPTELYDGEFQIGSSLDFHVGDYFVIGSTFRFGTEESLLYGFSGTVKF
jgi:hypothetical protein